MKITKKALKQLIKKELRVTKLQEQHASRRTPGRGEGEYLRREPGFMDDEDQAREAEADYRDIYTPSGGGQGEWRDIPTSSLPSERYPEGWPRGKYHGRRVELEQGQEVSPYHDLAAAALTGDETAWMELQLAAETDPNAQAILDAAQEEYSDKMLHESRRGAGYPKNSKLMKITKKRLKEIIKEEYEALNLQEVGPRSDVAWGTREAEIDYGAGGGYAPTRREPGADYFGDDNALWAGDDAYHGRSAELEHGQEVSPYHDLAAAAAAGDSRAAASLMAAAETDPNAQAMLDALWEDDEWLETSDPSDPRMFESRQRRPKNFKLTKNTLKHLVKKEFKRLK